MSTLQIRVSEDQRAALIEDSRVCPQPVRLEVPEFHGKTDQGPFAISQFLRWQKTSSPTELKFELEGEPRATGLEFRGRIGVVEDEVHIKAHVRNVSGHTILSGHHSWVLDATAAPDFHDPTGERTLMYAETGWVSLAQLLDPLHTGKHTIRMGATYNQTTVMWKLMARCDSSKKRTLALALDKGYAFAGDHPEWPKGLMGGYRWGTIGPGERKTLIGKIYVLKGPVTDLRLRYVKDFK